MSIQNKKIILEQLNVRFNFLANADNAVEAKAGTLLGFSIAIILAFLIEAYPDISLPQKIMEARAGSFLLTTSILTTIVHVLKTRRYASNVVKEDKIEYRLKLSEDEFVDKTISNAQSSNNTNANFLKDKVRGFKISLISFILGVSLLALSSTSEICL